MINHQHLSLEQRGLTRDLKKVSKEHSKSDSKIGLKSYKKKGFVFSLDAFFALILSGIFLAVVFAFLSSSPALSPALGNLASDEISMLDSSGALTSYITTEDNSTILDIFHTLLPNRYCYQLTVYDDDMHVEHQIVKRTCTLGSESRGVGYQTVVMPDVPHQIYLAKLEVWEP